MIKKEYSLNESHAVLILGWLAGGLLLLLGYGDMNVGPTMLIKLKGALFIAVGSALIIGVTLKKVRTSKWGRGIALITLGVVMSIPSALFVKDWFVDSSLWNQSSRAQEEAMIHNADNYVVVTKRNDSVVSQRQATKADIKGHIQKEHIKGYAAMGALQLPVFILALICFWRGYTIIKSPIVN